MIPIILYLFGLTFLKLLHLKKGSFLLGSELMVKRFEMFMYLSYKNDICMNTNEILNHSTQASILIDSGLSHERG